MAQTKKLVFALISTITLFLTILERGNSSSSILSFNFERFKSVQHDLIFQGDASVSSSNTLQLTKTENNSTPARRSIGRVLYSTPIQLWDTYTDNEVGFETTFSFRLTSPSVNFPAHGLAFFIAPPDTTIPSGSMFGYLGLFDPETALNASANQVVHVEFDTYPDPEWGEVTRHIGININTINSTAYVPWDRKEGEIASVRISYNPEDNGRLTVVSTYASTAQVYAVSHFFKLKSVLPEWVRIGFSASTGDYIQTHDILNWSFTSYWHTPRVVKHAHYSAI